ncbi:MAG: response regulator [Phaeodactylibacter sp.]|uniref:hybrid sensor histidine kinase/response regulator transcription factor n=1 Tax=Phaeodactylibacter sp. TaxID=1940289 RepID=UPI0032ECABFD
MLFSLFLFFSSLFAQKHLFDAQLITVEEGLANLYTTAVFKDSRGFIWIGTRYGLNRYDGDSFKLYSKENGALNSSQNILKISEDAEGNLWLFYKNQYSPTAYGDIPDGKAIENLDIFNPRTGRATPFDAYFEGKAPVKSAEVILPKSIIPGALPCISTNKGEVYLYDGAFKKIFEREGVLVSYIIRDSSGDTWIGWWESLARIDSLGTIKEEINLPGRICGIYPGPDGMIWLATLQGNDYLNFWSKADKENPIPFFLTRDGRPVEVALAGSFFFYRTQKGYWYVQMGEELNVFDEQGGWLYDFNTLIGDNYSTNFVNYFEDDIYMWLATPDGLLKTSVARNNFRLIHQRNLGTSDCRGITEDPAGNIYFLNKALYRWNTRTQACEKLSDSYGAFALAYQDSLLWAGDYTTTSLGYELDLRNNKETLYEVADPKAHLAYSVLKTSRPGYWLAGLHQGLAYIDLKNKQVIPFKGYGRFAQLQTSQVNHIYKNNTGIWLATNNGVFLMNEQEAPIRHFTTASGDLPFDYIQHMHEDRDQYGVFWLATRGGGVIRWRPAPGAKQLSESRQFTTAEGLSNNFTYAVYEDDYGKLWIPSDKGLMWMDKYTYQLGTFLVKDGLPHNEFNTTAHYQAKDGTLYFGGLGGLIAFHPRVFTGDRENNTPLEFIACYLLEGDAENMTDKTELLQQTDVITIRPSDKFLELHFMLLDYDDSKRHRYSYQIEGYSDNWRIINENFLRITKLPYGNYTLRVRGKNPSDGWSNRMLSLKIKVLKPFYLQWWFTALVITGIIGATLAAVQWRILKLKEDRERLEAEVQKRTRQIEKDKRVITSQAEALQELDKAKTRFFSNITHEFRTPLTLIIGPLEQILSEQPPPTILRRRVQGVLKNTRHILELVNQMLDLSKIESKRMQVEATRGDIIAYTQELAMRFQPLVEKKELKLYFVAGQDRWETNFDQDKWDKTVYNLLSNAIKFTPPGNDIQLAVSKSCKDKQEFIRLDVKDTGMGIGKDQLRHVFNRFYQIDGSATRAQGGTGIGLALVKELVELQGGQIKVSSEPGKGTLFQILLPVLKAEAATPLANSPAPEAIFDPEIVEAGNESTAIAPALEKREKQELLIIEDNEEMREYLRYCISEDRYNINEAADGEEGIEKAQSLIPDLIISDVMMPKKDGFAVTQAIRSNLSTSHIPLILLTARASLESRLKGLQRGADAYLTKPFSPQELALRIQKLIEIRRLLQQRYQDGAISTTDDTYRQEDEFIVNLREYILEHIDESNLSGDRIGRHFGMSRTHLHRKLKALTGQPITDFVRSIRLQKALELIREGELNVSEIAYQAGFSSLSHFSRSFKKAYGKSPSEV